MRVWRVRRECPRHGRLQRRLRGLFLLGLGDDGRQPGEFYVSPSYYTPTVRQVPPHLALRRMPLLSHTHQRPRQLAGGEGAHRHVHGLAELDTVLRGGEVVPAHAQLEGGGVGGDAQRGHGHAEEVYSGEGM